MTGLEDINEIDSQLGRTYIMCRNLVLDLASALLALKTVIFCVGISETELELKVEVLRHCPRITIRKTTSDEVTLITGVGQSGEIVPEELLLIREIAEIVCTAVRVDADERARHTVAEPVPHLRLHESMLVDIVLLRE